MDWFRRHLNWTIALAWIAPYFAMTVSFTALGAVFERSALSPEAAGRVAATGWGVAFVATGLLALWVSLWALRHKNRSAWWMLFPMFVPLGFIVLFMLGNRSRYSGGL